MAQSIPTNSVIEITCFCEYQSQTVLNVFHYYNSTTDILVANGDAELATLITNHVGAVWAGMGAGKLLNNLVPAFHLRHVRAQRVYPVRQYYIEQSYDAVGTVDEAGCPSDVSNTISLRTARVGRGLTGNKKITGLPASAIEGNQWSDASRANLFLVGAQIATTLMDSEPAARWVPIIWSPARPADRALMVSLYPNTEVRVLRTRQRGLGI